MTQQTTPDKTGRMKESVRLLQLDLDKEDMEFSYGFRVRCRSCMLEVQANLISHAVKFMERHRSCERRPGSLR